MDGADAAAVRQTRHFARGDFAAGVAASLIRLGVRGVVAAGWAVGDDAAGLFARQFYQALLEGKAFGDAVYIARRETYRFESSGEARGNTWAAYQCYGDPDWTLRLGTRSPGGAAGSVPPRTRPAVRHGAMPSAPALALVLDSLAVDARWTPSSRERVRLELAELEQQCAAEMGQVGAVAEAFALVHELTGGFDAAIRWYARALHAADGTASMRVGHRWDELLTRGEFQGAVKGPVALFDLAKRAGTPGAWWQAAASACRWIMVSDAGGRPEGTAVADLRGVVQACGHGLALAPDAPARRAALRYWKLFAELRLLLELGMPGTACAGARPSRRRGGADATESAADEVGRSAPEAPLQGLAGTLVRFWHAVIRHDDANATRQEIGRAHV
jgi:hypothetical protein